MSHEEQTKLTVQNFFDNRAASYKCVSRWAADERLNAKTDEFLDGIRGRRALDIGAGTGLLISRVHAFKVRIALDISQKMLLQIKDPSVEKVVGDIHYSTLADGCADLVICRQLLHYCNLASAFRNIVRALIPGGYLHIVQVIDYKNVPNWWDQEWASFRNVGKRRHQRRSELEEYYAKSSLPIIKSECLRVRDEYLWSDFFLKNNVESNREKEVKRFFEL